MDVLYLWKKTKNNLKNKIKLWVGLLWDGRSIQPIFTIKSNIFSYVTQIRDACYKINSSNRLIWVLCKTIELVWTNQDLYYALNHQNLDHFLNHQTHHFTKLANIKYKLTLLKGIMLVSCFFFLKALVGFYTKYTLSIEYSYAHNESNNGVFLFQRWNTEP